MARRPAAEAAAAPPWWIQPSNVALAVVLPLLIASLLVSQGFQRYFDRPQKFMSAEYFIVGLLAVAALAAGAYVGSRVAVRRRPAPASPQVLIAQHRQRIVIASRLILAIALIAYALYLSPLAAHPGLFLNILRGSPGASFVAVEIKENVRIPGITSFSQLGILYAVLFVIRLRYLPDTPVPALERRGFALLVALTMIRAVAYSERLAIIELLLPACVVAWRNPRLSRPVLASLPFLAAVGLFAFFALSEYLRSWQDHYRDYESDFLRFAGYRLFGYYVTALDNGAGFLDHLRTGVGPVTTLQWIWSFPVSLGQEQLLSGLGIDRTAYSTFLHYYADPEFNNMSGLFAPFVDYGVSGGAFFWILLGYLSGVLFRSYLQGRLAGLLLYPVWFLCIVEIPRVFSFSGTRYFPVIVVSLGLIIWFRCSARPQQRRPSNPSSPRPGRHQRAGET
jgi:oligosaccharide repeat unit polymerase